MTEQELIAEFDRMKAELDRQDLAIEEVAMQIATIRGNRLTDYLAAHYEGIKKILIPSELAPFKSGTGTAFKEWYRIIDTEVIDGVRTFWISKTYPIHGEITEAAFKSAFDAMNEEQLARAKGE